MAGSLIVATRRVIMLSPVHAIVVIFSTVSPPLWSLRVSFLEWSSADNPGACLCDEGQDC
jgi:hypothetical protein